MTKSNRSIHELAIGAAMVLACATSVSAQTSGTYVAPQGTTMAPPPSTTTTITPSGSTTVTAPSAATPTTHEPPPGYTTTTTTTTSTQRTEQPKQRKDNARLRIGLEAGIGGIFGPTKGLEIAIIGQLGIQFSDHWGLYYAPSLLIGGAGSSDQIRSFVATGQAGMLAINPSQHIELDAGGGAAIGFDAQCRVGEACSAGRSAPPMVAGRLAFNIGFHSVRARLGLPLAFHYQGIFLAKNEVSHTILFTIGILRY